MERAHSFQLTVRCLLSVWDSLLLTDNLFFSSPVGLVKVLLPAGALSLMTLSALTLNNDSIIRSGKLSPAVATTAASRKT